jgi:DNA-binding NarL/FixJ family response regulator
MPMERAIAQALSPLEERCDIPAEADGASEVDNGTVLTWREREVSTLIAQGLTNRQIADELVISERTVDTHVANILRKLGFACRAQVEAWSVGRLASSANGHGNRPS